MSNLSLCSGYGGLDLAVEQITGNKTLVYAENDPFASQVMAARFPWAINLGDISKVDWRSLAGDFAPDTISAGFPCGRRSGKTSLKLWASFDRASSSWKTFRRSSRAASTSSPQTWPKSGMTRGGLVYQLQKSGRRTSAAAGSASRTPLLPTPSAADGTGGPGTSPKRKGGLNLRTAVTRLPGD